MIADDSQETMISHCKIVRVMNTERVNTIFLLLCHRGSIIMRNTGEIEKQKGQCYGISPSMPSTSSRSVLTICLASLCRSSFDHFVIMSAKME